MIGTDAASVSHWALDVAPAAALSNIDAEAGLLAGLSRRLRMFWPELAGTVMVEAPGVGALKPRKKRKRKSDVPLAEVEASSNYAGPSDDAVSGDDPDE